MIGIAGSVAWVLRLRLKQNTGVHGQRCAARRPAPSLRPREHEGCCTSEVESLLVSARFRHLFDHCRRDGGGARTVARTRPKPGLLPATRPGPTCLGAIPRYEGSPILWHLVLALPARCGLPYASLGVLGAAFAGGGVLLFLARSPLPKFLTAIVPFTFFLIYQNAVVARSYALMPLLLFAAAAAYPGRHRRPLLYVGPLMAC